MSVAGVVLAGGRSSRMGGGEKALLSLGGVPLLDRALQRLGPQVAALAVNANRERDSYAARGWPVLGDTIDGYPGPLAGVLAAMRWAAGHATHVVTVAGDTPFFPETLVSDLSRALTGPGRIAMAVTPDPDRGISRHPTFALWPVDLADDLEAALTEGTRKILAWTDRHGTVEVRYPVDPFDPFFNVNTPEDMAAAEAISVEHGL